MLQGHNRAPFRAKLPGTTAKVRQVPPAVIYRPARRATTSGPRPDYWLLEFQPLSKQKIEPLMGWTSSDDPFRPIRLRFADKDSAVQFALRNDWPFLVREDGGRDAKKPGRQTAETAPRPEAIDPVIEADLESFPASDPPAWTGTSLPSRKG